MHELVLVFAIIAVTLLVLAGIMIIFHRWLILREELTKEPWSTMDASDEAARGHETGPAGLNEVANSVTRVA